MPCSIRDWFNGCVIGAGGMPRIPGRSEEGYLRVIDESGEDYLYPESYFVHVPLPLETQEALRSMKL